MFIIILSGISRLCRHVYVNNSICMCLNAINGQFKLNLNLVVCANIHKLSGLYNIYVFLHKHIR